MYIRYLFTAVFAAMMITGCTKDFNLTLPDTMPHYVIEGRISNLKGPYYVRITKSTSLLGLGNQQDLNTRDSGLEAVTGAQVIVSDDMGLSDTLTPAVTKGPLRYFYIYKNGQIDSAQDQRYCDLFTSERGYYQTTKITGIPAHIYRLTVKIGDSVFHASAYMPVVPTLDSAALTETVVDPAGTKGFLPYAWFQEPQHEKNYYLLQYNNIADYRYDIPYGHAVVSETSPYYVTDDKVLPPYVNGMAVRVTSSGHSQYGGGYYYLMVREPLQLRLSSLTKESYEYFLALGRQFEDDGNIYKPVPASANGNISGGALGLFWATHVSYKMILP